MSEVLQDSTKQTTTQVDAPKSQAETLYENKEVAPKETVTETKVEVEQPKKDVEYKFDLGDEVLLDDAYIEKIAEFAKEQGFTNDVANKIAQRENSLIASYIAEQEASHEKLVNDWAKQIESDKDFGGEKFKDNVNYAHQVINKFGSEEFKKALNESGYGNHPELFKVFAKIGQAMKSDELVHGQSLNSKPPKSKAEILYGTN